MAPKKKTAPKTPKGVAKKQPAKKAKKLPKPKPPARSVTKKVIEIDGVRPLSDFDYRFCQAYVRTGKQAAAYREINPEAKDPHVSAHRMMERPEIRDHIRAIYKEVSASRERAAQVSARSLLLSLELADERLLEILETPRKTRAEMFTKDTKQVFTPADLKSKRPALPPVEGETAEEAAAREDYNQVQEEADREAQALRTDRWLQAPAPVEDADILKAVKLTYERRQGIIKAEKEPERNAVAVMLYQPGWRKQKTIEGGA